MLWLQNCIFKPLFGYLVTLAFDHWTSIFQKHLTLPQKVFSIDKSCHLVPSQNSFRSKTVILPIFGHVVTLTFDP